MLGKAVGEKLIRQAPLIHLAEEIGRDGILDDATEQKLLAVADSRCEMSLSSLVTWASGPQKCFG